MASAQVLFQYLTPGSHTVTVPAGFSNQLLVYAWGAGGGAGSQTSGFNGQRGGGGGLFLDFFFEPGDLHFLLSPLLDGGCCVPLFAP